MEHNMGLYGVAIRYILCLFSGMIGGLSYSSNPVLGIIVLTLAIIFFLEAILAFDPILFLLGKNNSKESVKDFK